jgi:conjugal transfer ATP-binding protein TraC
MLQSLRNGLFGDDTGNAGESGGLLGWVQDVLNVRRGDNSSADQFASWLPYSAYIAEEQLFVNRDGMGFLLEVLPQSGADERMVEVLLSLYASCPVGTGIQYHLFGSPHVYEPLRRYANLRVEDDTQVEQAAHYGRPARNSNIFRVLARHRVEHLLRGAHKSLTTGFHYCIRDFRLMVSVCLPGTGNDMNRREELMNLREAMVTTLRAASLPSKVCDASDLINWCALFANPDRIFKQDIPRQRYDDGREIRDQIVDYDTIQDATAQGLQLFKEGNPRRMEARFYSIKSFPAEFGLWQMGSLIGDLMQPALQYNTPFLLTMGVRMLDPNAMRHLVTANHIRAQQNADSKMARIMPDVSKKLKDWGTTADAIDVGGSLVSMYHQLALFTEPEKMVTAEETAKAIWRVRGFELNADVHMHRQALLASLPLTLSAEFHGDLKKMRRVTHKTVGNAIHLAPLIGEWRGTATPTLIFGGRRGQLMTMDLYDNDLGNYNFAVIGAPGSGKSVLLNEIAWSYRAINAQVWIMDLGRSMEKLCRKSGGMYVEFSTNSNICVNPFTMVSPERKTPNGIEGGINEDIDMLCPAIAKMCSMQSSLGEVQYKALQAMILKKYKEYGPDLTVTGLRDALKSGTLAELALTDDQRIKDLAVMLNPYSKDGQYSRFFEGRNNIDFSNDFMVIENEELKRKPDLHAVVNILLMYQITGQMYLTRNRKKILMIDELKQQLGDIGADDPIKAAVVEEAARRARKYGGALGTATQSADDYYGSAQMEAAFNCSDWVFLLRQKKESISLLRQKGRISMDEGKQRLLESLRTEPGVFSEIYVGYPGGEGVARLCLDPWTNLLFSNKLTDNAPIDELRSRGLSVDQAIEAVLRQRGEI